MSDEPGVSLFVRVAAISSGSWVDVYTFASGRLTAAGPTLGYGGDSGARSGYACHSGQPPTIVEHEFVLVGPGENGRWRETDITYAWRGAALRQIAQRTSTRRGVPPSRFLGAGVGCANLARGASPAPPTPNAVAKCVAGDLRIGLGPQLSPQTGEDGDIFVIRNASGHACQVRGYPTVALSSRGGELPFVYRRGGAPYVTTRPPQDVVLAANGRAYLLVAKYRCDGRGAHAATRIRIALPASVGSTTLALPAPGVSQLDYCHRYPGDHRIDPGNYVFVSPIKSTLAWLARAGP